MCRAARRRRKERHICGIYGTFQPDRAQCKSVCKRQGKRVIFAACPADSAGALRAVYRKNAVRRHNGSACAIRRECRRCGEGVFRQLDAFGRNGDFVHNRASVCVRNYDTGQKQGSERRFCRVAHSLVAALGGVFPVGCGGWADYLPDSAGRMLRLAGYKRQLAAFCGRRVRLHRRCGALCAGVVCIACIHCRLCAF